jgi:signal transduction histidine kinase
MASTTATGATGPSFTTRFRDGAFWATIAGMAVAAVLYFVGSLSWFDRPYPGFKLRIDQAVELQLPPQSTGARAGLMPGDRVVAVDGRALSDPRALYAYVATKPIGTPVTYDLDRFSPNGEKRRLTKVIATQAHDARQWASTFLALWLTGLCFLALGAAVSILKPGDPLARANLAFHLAGAAACISIFDQSTTYHSPFNDPYKLLPWIIAVCFANLALQFPRKYPLLERVRRLNLIIGSALAIVLVGCYYVEACTFWVSFSHLAYIAVGELILIASALWTHFSPQSTPREKGQSKALLVGLLVSTVPALLVPQAHFLGVHVDLEGLENFVLPLWPLAISYAVVRYQLFDISPLIRRSLVYLLSATVLSLIYVAGTTATEALIGSQTHFPGIVATVLVAFAFAPVRDHVKRWLDARFFRSPYRFDAVIAAFTRMAQETVEPEALLEAYVAALDGALAPSRLAIVLSQDGRRTAARLGCSEADCQALAPLLETGATSVVWQGTPTLCLPLVVQDRLLGHAVVGPKKSELAYTERDRALLHELTQLLAVWLNLFERFEKVRRQTQEISALRRSEAMQGQFLNVVSHELKIPLSVIMSSLNILERSDAAQDAKTVRHLTRIRRSLADLVGLVGDLLNAGQLQSGHFHLRTQTLDFAHVVAETVAEMKPLAENKTHELSMTIDAALPPVCGDETRLAQVLRNLIHNAIRYTPAGGRIQLSLEAAGPHLRCEVRDDGPGIEAAAMPHLFQRFSQVHSEAADRDQGVGLGLFISKAIVEAHGGAIGVESAPGAGSAFWFTLPALREREEAASSPSLKETC